MAISDGDLDIDFFEEEDWDFLSDDASVSFEYFDDIHDTEFIDSNIEKRRVILFSISASIFAVAIVASCIFIYTETIGKNFSSNAEVASTLELVDKSAMEYVDGKDVSSDTLLKVSKTVHSYFQVMNSESGFSRLNELCIGGSLLATTEESYRKNSMYSYDTNDCNARALRAFAVYVKLDKVTRVIEKDGEYYCYISVSSPHSSSLFEWLTKYSADLTRYFKINRLTAINVTKYILQTLENGDIPLVSKEYMIKIKKVGRKYMIVSDVTIQNLCASPYNDAVDKIVSMLGGTLVG